MKLKKINDWGVLGRWFGRHPFQGAACLCIALAIPMMPLGCGGCVERKGDPVHASEPSRSSNHLAMATPR